MKRVLFFIICIYSFSGFCQERFFKVFDHATNHDFGFALARSNTNFYIAGLVDDNFYRDYSCILIIDEEGELDTTFTKRFSNENSGAESLNDIQIFKNKIFFCGSYRDKVDDGGDGIIAEFIGDSISYRPLFYDIDVNDSFEKLFVTERKIYFGGQIIENNNAILFLAAIDTSGNLLWNKTYDAGGFHYFTSLEPTQDGQLLVGGYVNQGSLYKNLMLKYDTLGNLLWENKVGSNNFVYAGGYALEAKNGDLIQVGIKAKASDLDDIGSIIRYDKDRNTLYNKTYNFNKDADYIEIFNKVIELDDESLVIGGGMEDTIKEDDPVTLLVKTDKEGNVLWRRTYSYYEDDTHTYFEDFIQTNDGGFAITGYVIPPPAIRPLTKNDMFLLKVDEFGCLTPGCELVDVPEIKLDKVKPDLLQVYPNPVSSHLNMISTTLGQHTGDLKIYNIEGKLVLQQPFTNQLDVSNLPKGQYVISYWEENEFVDSELFIKK